MSDTPDLSTLPKRMRYAAQVVKEATVHAEWRHRGDGIQTTETWAPYQLAKAADVWEAEDDALIDDLGRKLELAYLNNKHNYDPYWLARRLIQSGWRKGGSDA